MMKKYYKCWRKSCKTNWVLKKDLVKRLEDTRPEYKHTDFVCPDCESVIICTYV